MFIDRQFIKYLLVFYYFFIKKNIGRDIAEERKKNYPI